MHKMCVYCFGHVQIEVHVEYVNTCMGARSRVLVCARRDAFGAMVPDDTRIRMQLIGCVHHSQYDERIVSHIIITIIMQSKYPRHGTGGPRLNMPGYYLFVHLHSGVRLHV